MTVFFPIVALADGEVADPQWFSDITEAVNDHEESINDLELLTTSQSVSSTSASSAIGTTATAVLTLSGCVLRAGRAYSIENIGGVFGDATGRLADFSLWKTSTAGTQIGAYYRSYAGGGGLQTTCYGKIYMRRSAASDITFNLVLAMASNTGTVTHDAFTNRPRALVVTDVGPQTAWSFAFDVT
jgi:hypothetical protein